MGGRAFDNPSKRAWWLVHFEAHRKSGLTVTKYCAAHGLCRTTFEQWRREITDWEARKSANALRRRRVWTPISADRRRQATQAFWAMHVEAWQWSGLTVHDYCLALRLSPHSLKRWRNLFETEEVEIDWRALLHPSARPLLGTNAGPRTSENGAGQGLTPAGDNVARRPPRRMFTTEQKRTILLEAEQPGHSISSVSRAHGIATSVLFRWREQLGMVKEKPAAIVSVRVVDGHGHDRVGDPILLADLLPRPNGMVVVELADGRLVFAPRDADPDAVRREVVAREELP